MQSKSSFLDRAVRGLRELIPLPLSPHIQRICGALGARRLAGLKWFWVDGLFVQGVESFTAEYMPLFALAAGATAGSIGMLAAVANLVSLVAFLPGALVVSRLRRRIPFILSMGYGTGRLMLLVLALLPFMVTDPSLLVALIIAAHAMRLGLGSMGNAAWSSLSADLIPAESRGRYFGSRHAAMGLLGLAAAPLAGWIIKAVNGNHGEGIIGYQAAMGCAFLLGLASAFFFSRIPEPPLKVASRLRRKIAESISVLASDRLFLGFCISSIVWNFGFSLTSSFFNVYMVTVLGGNASIVGVAAGISAVSWMLGQIVFGRYSDRRGNRAALILAGVALPIMPALWLLARSPYHVFPINALTGFFWAGYHLTSFNFLLEKSPAEHRESAFAVYQTAVSASMVAGPLLGGYLVETIGFQPVFVISAGTRLLGTLLFIVLARGSVSKKQPLA